VTDQTPTPADTTPRQPYGIASIVVAASFGLFYAYDLWEAVSTFFELPTFYRAFGYDVDQLPWWVLVIMLVLPVVVYVIALLVGRRRPILERALVLLVGLSLVAGMSLGLIALESILRPGLLSGVLG
jgi:hypothetical protein